MNALISSADVIDKVLAGERINKEEALELYGLPIEELGALADHRRKFDHFFDRDLCSGVFKIISHKKSGPQTGPLLINFIMLNCQLFLAAQKSVFALSQLKAAEQDGTEDDIAQKHISFKRYCRHQRRTVAC